MTKHPAKFSDVFLPDFAEIVSECNRILDPFGGTGKLAAIKDYGFSGKVFCSEIEREWVDASPHPVDGWYIGDSSDMPWKSGLFDAIVTSPVYGNRMSDHFTSKDSSKRITYRHFLGKPLHERNSGRMQWGEKYRKLHEDVYKECLRVLKIDGLFVLNISNNIRAGEEVDVTRWHVSHLENLGLSVIEERKIETSRMGFGQNGKLRVPYESIIVLRRRVGGGYM